MKTIYNDTITTIKKYNDFIEMRNYLFSICNDYVTFYVCDNIENIDYDTMCELNDYYNDCIKYINKINDISFYNDYYLFDNNDTTLIIFIDENNNIRTFNLFDNDFAKNVVFNNKICIKIDDLLNAIIDKLNEQITINEQNRIIIEN